MFNIICRFLVDILVENKEITLTCHLSQTMGLTFSYPVITADPVGSNTLHSFFYLYLFFLIFIYLFIIFSQKLNSWGSSSLNSITGVIKVLDHPLKQMTLDDNYMISDYNITTLSLYYVM